MKAWSSALAALLLLAGCGDAAQRMVPVQRLVDLTHPDVSVDHLPVATLRDDTRTVLRGHVHAPLVVPSRETVTLDARFLLRPPLPAALAGSRRLILLPRVRSRGEWSELPAATAAVLAGGGGEHVEVDLALPHTLVGSTILVAVEAFPQPESPRRVVMTPAVAIRAGSRLEFGIGVAGPPERQAAVRYSVQACEESNCEEIFGEELDSLKHPGWNERSVALDGLAGERVAFRFETLTAPDPARTFALPVWSNPTVLAPSRSPGAGMNVLLFSLDTLRADRLPIYGYPLDTAPILSAKFGAGGTVVDSFVAAATTTGPSHMSLFTSLLPSVHGVRLGLGLLAPDATTLAQVLREAGFATAAVTEDAALAVERGFGRGFDSYVENKSSDESRLEGLVETTFDTALAWIASHRDRRFFLFVHTYQVHHPYTPPERYAHLFTEPAAGFEPAPNLPAGHDPAAYDREIRYLDDQMGRFLAALDEMQVADNTLVIVTSDHGEEFMEHGAVGHGANLNAEVTHVPLMFAGPGIPHGRRLGEPLGHIDLMPTLLELLDLRPPAGVMGRSFARRLREDAGTEALADVPLYADAWRVGPTVHHGPPLAIRIGDRKLIRIPSAGGVRYQYYDLASDPREQSDRFRPDGDSARDLVDAIDAYAAEVALRVKRRREAGGIADETFEEPEIDPDREAKLRALGYIE